jgi:hypothetical protein
VIIVIHAPPPSSRLDHLLVNEHGSKRIGLRVCTYGQLYGYKQMVNSIFAFVALYTVSFDCYLHAIGFFIDTYGYGTHNWWGCRGDSVPNPLVR